LDLLFNKNKLLIYKQCFRFIQLSQHIDTIYSPNPEENIFILVLFYKGIQCHYEVRPNFNLDMNLISNIKVENKNDNTWLISKCKYELDEQAMKVPFDYDIKIEIKNGIIFPMNDFLNKKIGNENEPRKENVELNQEKEKEKENISDVFNLSDFNGDSVNNNLINININNIQNNKIDHEHLNKKSQISHISHASTNAHSKKPSLSLSKNSKNKEEKEDKDEISFCNNFSESLNQYTSIIKKNSENIKKLENQVNKMELEIKEIIKNLEEETNEHHTKKKNNKKNIKKENNNNNNDISGLEDISINVPKIIYKDLSMTTDL
jgi:hypothetical protein